MASVTAPRNAAPTRKRATASHVGPPALTAAAMMPMAPMGGAMRSSHGGNSAPVRSRAAGARSIPVMAATRSLRFSASATWPDTPALRRTIETARATPVATTTPAEARSRTSRGWITWVPTYQAPAAISR